MKINPYLIFDGRAEEALNFYKNAFDGKIVALHRYAEAPQPCPESAKNRVMHGRLEFGDNVLMVGDSNGDASCGGAPVVGNNIQLSVNLSADETGAQKIFDALAVGGKIALPMRKTFWGAFFGMLTDRYGNAWMVNCELATNIPSKPME